MKTIHTSHFRSPSVGCRARSTIWTGLPTAREKDQLSSLRLFRAYSQKETLTARDVALAYYENYNDKNIEGVLELIAEDVVYEDLIYQEPFRGRDAVKAYFDKIEQLVPKDIKFVVEDITDGDPKRVGVRWHVELDGVAEFPFSRGVSFYEINDRGQIKFARDIVEPTLKPGSAALGGISLVAPLVRQLNQTRWDPDSFAALSMAGFYAAYIAIVLLSPFPPGQPAWQTSPDTLARVMHESFNFFYVNIALGSVDMNPVPNIAEHPVDEALFNFVNAWSLMMWPVWLADPRGKRVGQKPLIWLGTMFLTNVFLPLYMTLRLVPEPTTESTTTPSAVASSALPRYAPAFGLIACVVGCVSLGWAAFGRLSEYGGLDARLAFVTHQFSSDRVFWAFCVDGVLYYIWQVWLMGACKAGKVRFIPFFGMALWLLQPHEKSTSS